MDILIPLAHWFGSAVCHQWPDHSYFVAGVELPLCARCTGMYLGALLALLYHALRHPRAIGLPPPWVLVGLVLFSMAWAVDGVNSFLSTIPGLSGGLYPPQNLLRLSTGMLMGITIGTLVFVLFNSLVWRRVSPERVLGTPLEFVGLIVLGELLVLAVHSQWGALLLPLSLLALVAILVLHAMLMAAMAANMRRPSENWRESRVAVLAGTVVSLFYLDAIALARVMLGSYFGYPV